jgi:hypothetical protein
MSATTLKFGLVLAAIDEIPRAIDRVDDHTSAADLELAAQRLADAASRVRCMAACLRADETAALIGRRRPATSRGAA